MLECDLRKHYRVVFSSPSGRIVLHDILSRGNFFRSGLSSELPEELGRHNMAIEILGMLGAYIGDLQKVSDAIMDVLLTQPEPEANDD